MVEGDPVSLRRESRSRPEGFHILILDAFLGHTVPVHLLTKEAFELYLERLVILVHIGKPHLDLKPQLFLIGKRLGLKSALFESRGDGHTAYDAVLSSSKQRGGIF